MTGEILTSLGEKDDNYHRTENFHDGKLKGEIDILEYLIILVIILILISRITEDKNTDK